MNEKWTGPYSYDEIVEHYWPYDVKDAGAVVAAAKALPELVRYMNNATQNPERLSAPDLYAVLVNLNSAVAGLDQLLAQLSGTALELERDVTVYDDRHGKVDPVTTIRALNMHIRQARKSVGPMADNLRQATVYGSHLGHHAHDETCEECESTGKNCPLHDGPEYRSDNP